MLTHSEFVADKAAVLERLFPQRCQPSVESEPVAASVESHFRLASDLVLQVVHLLRGEVGRVAYNDIESAQPRGSLLREHITRDNADVRLIEPDILPQIGQSLLRELDRAHLRERQFLFERDRYTAASRTEVCYLR